MRLIDFRTMHAIPVDRYESREAAFARVARTAGPGNVACMYLGPHGMLGRHPAASAQLFCVVDGEGTVSGGDGVPFPICAGQAALWEPDEQHETSTSSGMVVMIFEVEHAIEPDLA
jgi:mannose-6-phosphate isomerase-like protein (cupin superfamily)